MARPGEETVRHETGTQEVWPTVVRGGLIDLCEHHKKIIESHGNYANRLAAELDLPQDEQTSMEPTRGTCAECARRRGKGELNNQLNLQLPPGYHRKLDQSDRKPRTRFIPGQTRTKALPPLPQSLNAVQGGREYEDGYTDWDAEYPRLGEKIHRGMALDLPSHLHQLVHDASRGHQERAHALLDHLRSQSLGMHWTDNSGRAHHLAHAASAPPETEVVIHALRPRREDIETDPHVLEENEVLGRSADDPREEEVPLRRGAHLSIKGLSWRPSSWYDDERDDPGGWTHHDFSESMNHHAVQGKVRTYYHGTANEPPEDEVQGGHILPAGAHLHPDAAIAWKHAIKHWNNDEESQFPRVYRSIRWENEPGHEHTPGGGIRLTKPTEARESDYEHDKHPPIKLEGEEGPILYHGTTHEHEPEDEDLSYHTPPHEITPGAGSASFGQNIADRSYAYATPNLHTAWRYAEMRRQAHGAEGIPHVYRVTPKNSKDVEEDPMYHGDHHRGNFIGDLRSPSGFDVLDEVPPTRRQHAEYAENHREDHGLDDEWEDEGHEHWASKTASREKLKPLPEKLYHVTTARDDVLQHGLKTRDELGQQYGHGLGGAHDAVISLTSHRPTAEHLLHSLHEYHDVLNGKIKLADLKGKARQGVGAKKPYDYMLKDHPDEDLAAADEGRTIEHRMHDRSEVGEDWHPLDEGMHGTGPNGEYHLHMSWDRPLGYNDLIAKRSDVYKKFAWGRQGEGGHLDPLFIANDPINFASKDPGQFALMHVRPREGAHGIQMNDRTEGTDAGEWRATSGKDLDVVHHEGRKDITPRTAAMTPERRAEIERIRQERKNRKRPTPEQADQWLRTLFTPIPAEELAAQRKAAEPKPERLNDETYSVNDVSKHYDWEGFDPYEIEHLVRHPEHAQFTHEDVPVHSLRHMDLHGNLIKPPSYSDIADQDEDEQERLHGLEQGHDAGDHIPPIVVVRHGEHHIIADGSHRAAIAAERGHTHIPAFVTERTIMPKTGHMEAGGPDPFERTADLGDTTDWDEHYDALPDTVHRGFAMKIPGKLYDLIHDPEVDQAHVAKELINRTARKATGPHWSVRPEVAQDFAMRSGRAGSSDLPLVLHASTPSREDIETRPHMLHRMEIFDHAGGAHDEREVPVRKGRVVQVTGVSWKPHEEHPAADEQGWVHHDFSEPMLHQAAKYPIKYTRQTSTGYEDVEDEIEGPLFHGSRSKGLDTGDLITKGRKTNPWGDQGSKSQTVHFTVHHDTARDYADRAGGHVYEVEPTGEFKHDYSSGDFKTEHPLRVLRVANDWPTAKDIFKGGMLDAFSAAWEQSELFHAQPGQQPSNRYPADDWHRHDFERPMQMHAMRKQAHDSGDSQRIFHCPFCGAGQVIGRSDGTTECEFCHANFTVQVQPQFNSFPQTDPLTGMPIQIPGMPGQIGDGSMPPGGPGAPPGVEGDDGSGFPPQDGSGDEAAPDEGAEDGGDDGGDDKPDFLKSKSYRTASGHVLNEEQYLRHLAMLHAPDHGKMAALLRQSR